MDPRLIAIVVIGLALGIGTAVLVGAAALWCWFDQLRRERRHRQLAAWRSVVAVTRAGLAMPVVSLAFAAVKTAAEYEEGMRQLGVIIGSTGVTITADTTAFQKAVREAAISIERLKAHRRPILYDVVARGDLLR